MCAETFAIILWNGLIISNALISNCFQCKGTCSHLAPCYPGTCQVPDSCGCQSGFKTAVAEDPAVYKQNYCLQSESATVAWCISLCMNEHTNITTHISVSHITEVSKIIFTVWHTCL